MAQRSADEGAERRDGMRGSGVRSTGEDATLAGGGKDTQNYLREIELSTRGDAFSARQIGFYK